jgi:hypothetical protein
MRRSLIWNPLLGKPRYEHRPRLNPSHLLYPGLAGLWLFNEGVGLVAGECVSNHNATCAGSAKLSGIGKYGSCLSLDGASGGYCGTSWTTGIAVNFSFSVWINSTTNVSYGAVMGDYQNSTGADGWTLRFDSVGGALNFAHGGDAGFENLSFGSLYNQSWYHVIGVVTATSITFYVNGVKGTVNCAKAFKPGARAFRIGASAVDGASAWNGLIDLPMISNRLFTDSDALVLFKYPFGAPDNPRFIVEPRRTYFVPVGGAPPSFKPYWIPRKTRPIGLGVM